MNLYESPIVIVFVICVLYYSASILSVLFINRNLIKWNTVNGIKSIQYM